MFKKFKLWASDRPLVFALIVAMVCALVQMVPLGGTRLHWEAPVSAALGAAIGMWIVAAFVRRKPGSCSF